MKIIFEAIVPGWKGRELPAAFPLHIRILLRCSVMAAHLSAIFNYGKTFGMLNTEKREMLMMHLYHHPNAVVRNIAQWWKLTALMLQC